MADTYDQDIVAWAEQQGKLLRRRAAGELVNDAELDWINLAEEIETVGRNEVRAVLSTIRNIIRHKIYLLGWPGALAVKKWSAELKAFEHDLADDFVPSMTGSGKITDDRIKDIYADAVAYCLAHMDTPPEATIPPECPWTLEQLLAERS